MQCTFLDSVPNLKMNKKKPGPPGAYHQAVESDTDINNQNQTRWWQAPLRMESDTSKCGREKTSAWLKDMERLLRGSGIPVGPWGTERILKRFWWKAGLLDLTVGTRDSLSKAISVCQGHEMTRAEERGEAVRRAGGPQACRSQTSCTCLWTLARDSQDFILHAVTSH